MIIGTSPAHILLGKRPGKKRSSSARETHPMVQMDWREGEQAAAGIDFLPRGGGKKYKCCCFPAHVHVLAKLKATNKQARCVCGCPVPGQGRKEGRSLGGVLLCGANPAARLPHTLVQLLCPDSARRRRECVFKLGIIILSHTRQR